mmetsp:Transcript_58998/g.132065  ORF Transcript_58998/g.132065 Transcript_58998/m.132065 type:complete len:666 (+) Transcript_58998:60-2057(+)
MSNGTLLPHRWLGNPAGCCACAELGTSQAVETAAGSSDTRYHAQSALSEDEPVPHGDPQLLGSATMPWVLSTNSASSGSVGMDMEKRASTGSLNQPQPKRRWKAAKSSDSIMAGVWERIASTHGGQDLAWGGHRSATDHAPTDRSWSYSGQQQNSSEKQKSKWPCTSLRMALTLSCAILVLAACLGLLILQEVLIAKGMRDKVEFEDFTSVARMTGICMSSLAVLFSLIIGVSLGNTISSPLSEMREQMVSLSNSTLQPKAIELRRSHLLELAKIQDAFGRLFTSVACFCAYVPNTIVRGVLAGEDRLTRLHVYQRRVSILFSDIVDFTRISEALHQEDLLFILTWYLSTMTRIVESHNGIVAEILGDGLLCFWNTPDEEPDYINKTLAAALSMQAVLRMMNASLSEMEFPQLKLRIGIHTGNVLTGNIGSESKMKFGCLGDPVNVASRLESLCKHYGVGIICSASVRKMLPNNTAYLFRKLDLVQLKGKVKAMTIYEVLGVVKDLSSDRSTTSMSSLVDTAQAAMTGTASALRSTGSVQTDRLSQQPGRPSGREPLARTITLDHIDVSDPHAWDGGSDGNRKDHGFRPIEARRQAEQYEKALGLFQEAEFSDALKVIEEAIQERPEDGAALQLHQRIAPYARSDVVLSEDERKTWRGVLVMAEK